MSSNRLADEVLQRLAFRGLPADEGHIVVDPGMSHLVTTPDDRGEDSVMMIITRRDDRDVVVPICPGTSTLRVYARSNPGPLGELITEVTVKLDDGWGSAAAIVEALFGQAPAASE